MGDGSRFGVSVYYSLESELLGTAGAVSHLRGWLDHREFVVLYADNIIRCDLHAMIKKHKQLRPVATLALYWRDDTSASGVVDVNTAGLITRFMEKPENGQSGSHWVFAGLVVCSNRVFREIPCNAFSDFGRDVFPALLRAGYELGTYDLSEGETLHWIDTPADLLSTIDAYAKLEGTRMILARAPLRISLGGGGTDLPSYYSSYGGFVVGAAIDKYLYVYVNRPAADDLVRVKYSQYEEVSHADEVKHDLVRPALNLLGVTSNVEVASMADVPAGTGLGSSSAYLVALLVALHELKRRPIPPQALAELAGHVEIDLAGHPVGKQDHYMAAFGGITCLDINPDGVVNVSPLNVSISTLEELEAGILLFFTGVNRSANPILKAQRDDTERGSKKVIDSLHFTKELGFKIKNVLEAGDVDKFGLMMHEHWENKKQAVRND